MHNNIIPHVKIFSEELANYLESDHSPSDHETLKQAFFAFVRVMMDEYQQPENHTPPFQRPEIITIDAFLKVLARIEHENRDRIFIEHFPFIREILELHDIICPKFKDEVDADSIFEELGEIQFTLENMYRRVCVLLPLQNMIHSANAASIAPTYAEIMTHLTALIEQFHTYALHVPIDKSPYNRLDWRMLEILHGMSAKPEYQAIAINPADMNADFARVLSFLQQLQRYMGSSGVRESTVVSIHLPHLSKITQIFQDREYARQMRFILEQLRSIKNEDTLSNRLAIVRGLYALGAAVGQMTFYFVQQGSAFFEPLIKIYRILFNTSVQQSEVLFALISDKIAWSEFQCIIVSFDQSIQYLAALLDWHTHPEQEQPCYKQPLPWAVSWMEHIRDAQKAIDASQDDCEKIVTGMQRCIELATSVLQQNNISLESADSVLSCSVSPVVVLACEHIAVVFFCYAEAFLEEKFLLAHGNTECIDLVSDYLSQCHKMVHLAGTQLLLPLNASACIDAAQLTHGIRQIVGTISFCESLQHYCVIILRNKARESVQQSAGAAAARPLTLFASGDDDAVAVADAGAMQQITISESLDDEATHTLASQPSAQSAVIARMHEKILACNLKRNANARPLPDACIAEVDGEDGELEDQSIQYNVLPITGPS